MTITRNITSSITGSIVSRITGLVSIKNVNVLFGGDSLAFTMVEASTPNPAAVVDGFTALGMTATATQGAKRGAHLTESTEATDSFWDDVSDDKGPLYTSLWDSLGNKADITDAVLSFLTNDRSFIPSPLSESDAQAALEQIMAEMLTDFPSLERIYVQPIMRSITDTANDEWEAINNAVYGAVANQSKAYILPEMYDLPFQDAGHPTDTAELTQIDRVVKRIGFITGNYNKPMLGMEAISATQRDDGILLTINHNDGDDFTIPTNLSYQLFRLFYNGNNPISPNGAQIQRISGNQMLLHYNPITDGSIDIKYGSMANLADIGITPDVPRDNSPNALPLRRSSLSVTDTDIIRNLTGIVDDIRPDHFKTFDSGNFIDTVGSLNDGVWDTFDTGSRMEYDATAFGGAGGFISSNVNSRLLTPISFSGAMLFGGVVRTDAANLNYLWQGGFNGTPTTSVRLYKQTNGRLHWQTDQAGSTLLLGDSGEDWHDQDIVWLCNVRSTDAMDIYINTTDTIYATIDPNDAITTRNRLFYGGGTGAVYGELFMCNAAHDSGGSSLADIMADMKSRHNIV